MDLVESTEFLGPEFVLWVWWMHDQSDGRLQVGDEWVELLIDEQIMLEGTLDAAETTRLKGGSPADSPEAHKALQMGKHVVRVRMTLSKGERQWKFMFDAAKFATSGVKIPAELRADGSDESFIERMGLLEELDATLHAIYREFLTTRLSPAWPAQHSALKAWIALPTADETRA